MRFPLIWLLTLSAALLGAVPQAQAQETREGIALRNQMFELQQQVQALQQQVARQGSGGGTPTYLGRPGYPPPQAAGGSDMVAQLLARTQALEDEVRQLRGQVDEARNELQRQGADLGKRIDDLSFQMQNPQAGGASPGAAAPPAVAPQATAMNPALNPGMTSPQPTMLGTMPAPPRAPGVAPPAAPAAPARRTPELTMQEGNAALARRDYAAAEAAAHEVLSNYRTSPRAYDAQFLLAQSLAGQRQYSQAAIAYDDTYNRSRKGAYAPEALVGLANALTAINEKRAACDTLAKLRGEFPQPRQDVRESAAAAQQRAGCK